MKKINQVNKKERKRPIKNMKKFLYITLVTLIVGNPILTLIFNGIHNVEAATLNEQAFIDSIASNSMELANKSDLYPSVMIAQSILETGYGTSTLATTGNNYFGIKGTYNNQFISKVSDEGINGELVPIESQFKKYPTILESMEDYIYKIKSGPGIDPDKNDYTSWSPMYYSNAWKSNTATYKDATLALEGTYSTDLKGEKSIGYAEKLNNIIIKYNLTQYDDPATVEKEPITETIAKPTVEAVLEKSYDEVKSTVAVNYQALISRSTDTINTAPWGTEGYKTTAQSSEFLNQGVQAIQEKVTSRATWVLIKLDGVELGWIDKASLDIEKVLSTQNVNYDAVMIRENDSINTVPWGTEGFRTVARSADYVGKNVSVLKEATTRRATWMLVAVNGVELGWMDKDGLKLYDQVKSTKDANYRAVIKRATDTIATAPLGTVGYKTIATSSKYLNAEIKVIQEKVTNRATWALIELGGVELGWIDKAGLEVEKIISSKVVNYSATIARENDTINSAPWGTEGYKTTASSTDYLNKNIVVVKEAITKRATWALIELGGVELGWIDKASLKIYDNVLSTKNVNYYAVINRSTDTISTAPWGTKDFKTIARSSEYLNKEVQIVQEKVTNRATWALIKLNGVELGWIDKSGLNIEKIISTKNVNYKAVINRENDTINTKPWGTEGYQVTSKSLAYKGKEVTVVKEAITKRATWALVELDGVELGWIDKSGLDIERVISTKNVSYFARIIRNNDTINTAPWGTEGYVTTGKTNSYLNAEVKVTQEKVTKRATWALISINGNKLGWVDKATLKKLSPFQKTVFVDAGHGGFDPGAVAYGIQEKRLNLSVALKVRNSLESKGYEVIMSRTTDVFSKLEEISTKANLSKPDIFVSIHTNASGLNAYGIETFSYNGKGNLSNLLSRDTKRLLESGLLAKSIQGSLITKTGAFDRTYGSFKTADFHVIRQTEMPAVLVEMGFIDNTSERANLIKDTYQNKITDGIVQGIVSYFK